MKSDVDRFLTELKRRRVYKVAAVYAAAGFALLQALDIVLPALDAPDWLMRVLVLAVLVGFPLTLALAWIFDINPAGIERTEELPDDLEVPPLTRGARAVRIFGAVMLIALVIAGAGLWLRPTQASAGNVAPGAEVIAVLPFRTTGTGLDGLGEGMVDLLSTNLNQVGELRAIEPRQVLAALARHSDDAVLDAPTIAALGNEVGAGSVLQGSVVRAGAEVRLAAELRSITGGPLADASVSGSAENMLSLVDSLSLALLRDVWRSRDPVPSFDVRSVTSGSLGAIREFLAGESFYRQSVWDSATVHFESALDADSTFALAHLRLASTYGWREQLDAPRAVQHATAAERLAGRLPERDRALVSATNAFTGGRRAEALDSLEAFTARYPDDAEGWYLLGDVNYHTRGDTEQPDEVYAPFERVLRLDPSLTPALTHPLELSLSLGDSARFHRYLDAAERAGGAGSVRRLADAGATLWGSPEQRTQEAIADVLQQAFLEQPSVIWLLTLAHLQSLQGQPTAVVEILEVMAQQAPPAQRGMIAQAFVPVYSALGRVGEAMAWARGAEIAAPDWVAITRSGIILSGFADTTELGRSVDEAFDPTALGEGDAAWYRAQARVARSTPDEARPVLEGFGAGTEERISVLQPLLEGWALLNGGDTSAAVPVLRQAVATGTAHGWHPVVLEPYRFALWDAEARAPDTYALAADSLQSWRLFGTWWVTRRNLSLAEAHERAGRRQLARTYYTRFLDMLSNADPELEPWSERARRGLSRLEGQP